MDAQVISTLSDDELYSKLQEVGGPVGPILPSTREVYERRLYRILNAIPVCDSFQESDEEPEHKPVDDFVKCPDNFSPQSTSSPQIAYESSVEIRYRPLKSYAEAHEGIYFDRTSLARSSYRSDLQNAPTSEIKYRQASKQKFSPPVYQQSKKTSVVWIAVIAVVIILAILVYMNMESSNINQIPNGSFKHT